MPLVIDDLLAGSALDIALGGGTSALRRFLKLPPRAKVFHLLWKDFGKQTGLGRDEFYAFANDDQLAAVVDGLLSGTILADDSTREALDARISRRLVRVPEAQRADLAKSIAAATVRACPLAVREWGEATAQISTKLDVQFEHQSKETAEIRSSISRLANALGEPEFAKALLMGPLAQVSCEEDATRAELLESDGKNDEAAAIYLEIAQKLRSAGLAAVADSYDLTASRLIGESGRTADAAERVERVLRDQLGRHEPTAWLTARSLSRWRDDDWLARAWIAYTNWPNESWATNVLRAAISEDKDPERVLRWMQALLEIDAMYDGPEAVMRDLPSELPPLKEGPRVDIELQRIDALERTEGAEAADEAWTKLEEWAAAQPDGGVEATCMSRRGHLLARRGDLPGASRAYRQAMAKWSRIDHYDEQVADCYFSHLAAESLLGTGVADWTLAPVARAMESPHPTPSGVGRRMEQRAAIARIKGQFREAHREYLLAMAVHRRAGSLAGVLETSTRLGELYAATDHPIHALGNYIEAGDEQAAVALAKTLPPGQINEGLRAALAPWESGVIYSLARDVSTGLDVEIVTELLPCLLVDAGREPDGLQSLALIDRAKAALAATVLQVGPESRGAAMTQIRADLFNEGLHDTARSAARALITATDLGIVDARADLVACFLHEHPLERINPAEIPHIVNGMGDLRAEIVAAAQGGSERALTALLWAAADGDEWCALEELATRLAERYTAVETLTFVEVDGKSVWRQSESANFATGGLAARHASASARQAFVQRMLAIAGNASESQRNRWSAVCGLFNVAGGLSDAERSQLWAVAEPLARGGIEPLPKPDLLSAVQMRSNADVELQASAVELLGRLHSLGVSVDSTPIRDLYLLLLRHRTARIRAAAIEALMHVPDLIDPAELLRMLPQEDASVRLAIVRALGNYHPEIAANLPGAMLGDESREVRMVLITIAAQHGDTGVLRQIASEDPDAEVRLRAGAKVTE